MQYVDVGHKKHLEHCSGSRKRKQEASLGHVEIEGLDELEAEEGRMNDYEEEAEASSRRAKVHQQLLVCMQPLCCSRTWYRTHLLPRLCYDKGLWQDLIAQHCFFTQCMSAASSTSTLHCSCASALVHCLCTLSKLGCVAAFGFLSLHCDSLPTGPGRCSVHAAPQQHTSAIVDYIDLDAC